MKKKKTFHIHFVCSGNAYRSRMAETYLVSKQIPKITVSSSGLEADKHRAANGPICWYALHVLQKYQLLPYLPKPTSTQTRTQDLKAADLVIFMKDGHYQAALEKHRFAGLYEIWDIPDINDFGIELNTPSWIPAKIIPIAEETFDKIKAKVDILVKKKLKK